jgi:hypothetical protein
MDDAAGGRSWLIVLDVGLVLVVGSIFVTWLLLRRQYRQARKRRSGDTKHNGDPMMPSR